MKQDLLASLPSTRIEPLSSLQQVPPDQNVTLSVTCISTATLEDEVIVCDSDGFFSTINTEFEYFCNAEAAIEFFPPKSIPGMFNEEGFLCLRQYFELKALYVPFYIQALTGIIEIFTEQGIFLTPNSPYGLLDIQFVVTNEEGKSIELASPPLEIHMPQLKLPAPKQCVRPWEDAPTGLFTCRLTLVGSHIFDDATQAGYDVTTVDDQPPLFQKTLQQRLRYLQRKAPDVRQPAPLCWQPATTDFVLSMDNLQHTLVLTFQCMGLNLIDTLRLVREQCLYLESRGKFPYGETLAAYAEVQTTNGSWQHVGLLLPEQELQH